MKKFFFILFCCFSCFTVAFAQIETEVDPELAEGAEDPGARLVPMVKMGEVDYNGQNITYVQYQDLYIYANPIPEGMSRKQYNLLVRNIKKVLPYAKKVNKIVIETYETMVTIQDEKEKKAYLKAIEKEISNTYTPQMKKLTYAQGKLLIKLVDRECGSKSYNIVNAFLGPIRAGFYQAFAWTFGASLKKGYDPQGKDRVTERIVRQVESGQI